MKTRSKKWTPEEDALLTELWPLLGSRCRHRFMDRSQTAIVCRASLLRLRSPNHWSDADTAVLQAHYAEGGPEACAPLLEVQRNLPCIKEKANRLGLVRRPRNTKPRETPVCVLQSAMRSLSSLEKAWNTRVLEAA